MIQATVDRIASIIPIEQTFFASNQAYASIIKAQIPAMPEANILQEPNARHTAPCIGLGALHIRRLEPEAVMASLHADHFIADEEGFRQALLAAEAVAREGYLVTLGITPTRPETGYGYIERGQKLGDYNGYAAYHIDRFLEKPDLATAERFVASGSYYWNSGIFIWQISTLMQAFQAYMPDFYGQLEQLEQAIATGAPIEPIWAGITPQSIDVGIMEKAEKVAVIPVDIGWNDVGSWAAIYEINPADENNNVIIGSDQVTFDTSGSLIQGHDRLIATIGLKDVVIIDTGDALLVCAKDKAQDIKKVVTWLQENNRFDLL
jgi:mannose-1-phosphate guanylyltransferase